MKQAQYSFSTGALFPYESEDALAMIKNAGFDYAELMPQAISDASEAATRKFEKTGIRLASIHYPLVMFGVLYTAHRTMREDGRRFSKDLLTMGQRLGCKVMVVHPHSPSYPGYEELLEEPVIDNLLWLADECAKHDILMAMENSPYTCSTAEKLNAYVKELGHPNIKPMVDTTEAREADQDRLSGRREAPARRGGGHGLGRREGRPGRLSGLLHPGARLQVLSFRHPGEDQKGVRVPL